VDADVGVPVIDRGAIEHLVRDAAGETRLLKSVWTYDWVKHTIHIETWVWQEQYDKFIFIGTTARSQALYDEQKDTYAAITSAHQFMDDRYYYLGNDK
jgi:hypothetical protein